MNKSEGMSQNDKGWTKIGEKSVNLSKGRDEIAVKGSEKFSSIKLKVTDAAMIDVEDVQVEYEGGGKQSVDMDSPLSSTTGESKVIELNSGEKSLKKVSFVYKPRDNSSGSQSSMDSKSSSSSMDSKGSSSSMGSNGTMDSNGSTMDSKGTMGSKSSKHTMGSKSSKGSMGSKSSKAKIEVWGLKADTAQM